MTEMQSVIGRYQLKNLKIQIKKRNKIAYKVINSLKIFLEKYSLLRKPNFRCSKCELKNMKQNCNNCVHAFYRLNLFINIDRKKLKLLNNYKKVNCNEGPCPEIYKEKVFKKLKINTSQKLLILFKLVNKVLFII